MRILFLAALFLRSVSVFSQDKSSEIYKYARQVVDTLASPSMHGRGYVNNGDKVASDYIEGQMKSFGLKKFGSDYRQEFHLNVNTFPGEMQLKYCALDDFKCIHNSETLPGSGFIADPSCPSVKGQFQLVRVDANSVKSYQDIGFLKRDNFDKRFLYIDTTDIRDPELRKGIQSLVTEPPLGIKGIIIRKRCLTEHCNPLGPWDVAFDQSKSPIIYSTGFLEEDHADMVKLNIQAKLIKNYKTKNLISYIPGTLYPDSFIVFTAHYDHLGQMGKDTYFPGANDNASGSAMLLSLARYYSQPAHAPKYSVAFMAFSGEEAGLLGSAYYAEHPLFPLRQIKFLINMDIMGTGDEGITVVNGTEFKPSFDALQKLNEQGHYLPEVKIRGKAANSDHYPFFMKGVPDFFIYTRGGIKAYHDIYDKAQTLPLTKFEDVFHLLTSFESWLEGGNKGN
ncbi:MAG: M28 family metallopeptidase [Bacteroidia bacterium]